MWIVIGIISFIIVIFLYVKHTGSVSGTTKTLRGGFNHWKLISKETFSNKECLLRTFVNRKNSAPMLLDWARNEDNGLTKIENRLNELENLGLINYSNIDQLLFASALIIWGYENKVFSPLYFDSVITKLKNSKH